VCVYLFNYVKEAIESRHVIHVTALNIVS